MAIKRIVYNHSRSNFSKYKNESTKSKCLLLIIYLYVNKYVLAQLINNKM